MSREKEWRRRKKKKLMEKLNKSYNKCSLLKQVNKKNTFDKETFCKI